VRPPAAPARRHRPARSTALLVAFALVTVPAVAGAQPRSSAEVQRELEQEQQRAQRLGEELGAVRGEIADAETELAEIGIRLDDARARLRAAEGQVALAEAALEEAREEQASAEQAHERAEQLLDRTEQALALEESILTDQLVESFKYGTVGATRGAMLVEVLRRADDPNAFAVGMKQLKVVVDVQETTVTRVFELRDERAEQSDAAARARAHAVQAAADAKNSLEHLEARREEQAAIAADIERDEERQRTVLASLEADEVETQAVLRRVEAKQVELRAEFDRRRAAEEEAARRAAEKAAAEEAARARQAAARNRASSTTSGGSGGGAAGGPPVSGGYCPVVGAVGGRDFSNDWGYPRSGGRTHQGNDIFAARGTPIVAIQDGVVVRTSAVDRGLGGLTVTYRTADGSEWYNAHLETITAGIAPGVSVAAGEQIGTVGTSGNARGTPPHNHLGRRINGTWVNPYPTVAPLCR
jgi:murein DD-endopeptidase MepM/ murein hydrolase activator NlpD